MNMKTWSILATILLSYAAYARAAEDFGRLVWSDEFEGNRVDPAKWEFEVDAKGGGNNELQYYVTNNATVRDGFLFIEARKEAYTGPEGTCQFTSARLRTRNRGDWKYGRFEIRAKLPVGKGYWPAIWMLPTERVYGGWPKSGEIDIMELVGHLPNVVHGTLHYANEQGRHAFQGTNTTLKAGTFADAFHVFGLEWQPGEMRWYLDRQLYQIQTNWPAGAGTFPAPFDQRFHLILNVAVGGNWPGSPDGHTLFPQAMVVDYVRVYGK
jgi:beta-glucanase (GH16 family)